MKQLKVSPDLSLPLTVASEAICIVGIRGSGKTNTARSMAEEALKAGIPICVIDPTDAWWGLRSSRDGKGDGYSVFIFGGDHGDVPLDENSGKTIAEFLIQERVPVVLSLRHLRKNAQRRFVTQLFEDLYHLKGKPENRSPLMVFIDESPLFIPQRVMGEMAQTVGAVEDLIARGRNAGFGVVLISQRFSTINKDVTTQSDTIISHRLTSPQDRKSLAEWIEENATIEEKKETLASLATLKNGEAWVWAPHSDIYKRVKIRLSETFDSGATPKMGEKIATPKKIAEIDRDKLKARLSAAIEKQKADDPKELKKKIAELEKQVKAKSPQSAPAAKVDPNRDARLIARAKKHVHQSLVPLLRNIVKGSETLIRRGEESLEALKQHNKVAGSFESFMETLADTDALLPVVSREVDHHTIAKRLTGLPAPVDVNRLLVAYKRRDDNGDDEVTTVPSKGKMREMLIAMAQRDGLTSAQIGVRAGMSSSSGTFSTYLSIFRKNDWMRDDGDKRYITDEGREALGEYDPLPTGSELLKHWKKELGGKLAEMLDGIAKAYPGRITKEDLGEAVGMSSGSGTFSTYLSKLRTLELISRKGDLRASDELFDHPEPE